MPESHRVQRGRASKRQHGLLAVTVCLYGKVKSRVIQHTRKRGQVRWEGFGQYGGSGHMAANRWLPDWGPGVTETTRFSGSFSIRQTLSDDWSVRQGGMWGLSDRVSGAVSTRVSVCCRAASLPMVGGYYNCGMRGADNPASRYHPPRFCF